MDYDEKAAKRKMNIKSTYQLPSTELPLPEAQCVYQGVRETEEMFESTVSNNDCNLGCCL